MQLAMVSAIVVLAYVGFVSDAYRMGFILCFICGFAPSRFLRLDPC